MHSTEASDEPGITMDNKLGQELHAEPTITIPSDIQPVFSEASEFDAFVEIDTLMRFETAFVVEDEGLSSVLPYQHGLVLESVTAYDAVNQVILPISSGSYTVNDGTVSLIGYPVGTAFTVQYKANPVYIAWRRAGGMPHYRPFGAGTDQLPVRLRAQWLDMWLRARNPGSQSASPLV